ncbi:MAG: MinD/ParA family protein [Bdellovibrionales bacterium]|nr:MinD/ParA family protein [Bdellovibrionales bacterium]
MHYFPSFLEVNSTRNRTQTLSVTSGKGGVGKSTLLANLAYSLGQKGQKVLILDGDLGLANVDIIFGKKSKHTIFDVLNCEKKLQDILLEVSPNVYLIPGGSGLYQLSHLAPHQKKSLLEQVSEMDHFFNYLLIDTASGISENVLYLNSAAQDILVVVTPDPASITDSYALIKVLTQKFHENHFGIVVNLVRDEEEAISTYRRLAEVADRFLCVSLDFKGFILNDPKMRQATKKQQMIVHTDPLAQSSRGILNLVNEIHGLPKLKEPKGSLQFFWQQLSGVA